MTGMSNQNRHQKGAPASQGGKFAAIDRPTADAELLDQEQPLRDLGVTGNLAPYDTYDPEIPGGARALSSDAGRKIILYIEDGAVKAKAGIINQDGWTTFENEDGAEALIADAFHAEAASDHISFSIELCSDDYELRDVEARVSSDGALITEAMFSDDEGNWTTVELNHNTGMIAASRDGDDLPEDEAAEFLDRAGEQILRGSSWESVFRQAAAGMANDSDITAEVRAAAAAAGTTAGS